MKKESGELQFPIWLLGDSEPNQWKDRLEDPLDKRHPIRHNIWTSVLDVVQRDVFAVLGKRVDADRMYVRNAVQDSLTKPSDPFSTAIAWHDGAQASLAEYEQLVAKYHPRIVVTFGWFSFAFALRATGEGQKELKVESSQTALLGREFKNRAAAFDIFRTNVLPLLHRSIAGVHFLKSHDEFCGRVGGNYFEEAGKKIAAIIVQHPTQLDCWMNHPVAPRSDENTSP